MGVAKGLLRWLAWKLDGGAVRELLANGEEVGDHEGRRRSVYSYREK